jgi:hypothetical protein
MADTPGKKPKKPGKISLGGAVPSMELTLPLDAKKIAAIHKCLEKGELKITLSKVDFAGGRLGDPYIYD